MAKKAFSGSALKKEPVVKRTSIGQGKRKLGSWTKQRKKPSRGQGKG
jgi:hypothetical protein